MTVDDVPLWLASGSNLEVLDLVEFVLHAEDPVSTGLDDFADELAQLVLGGHGFMQFVLAIVFVDLDDHCWVHVQGGETESLTSLDESSEHGRAHSPDDGASLFQSGGGLNQIGVHVVQTAEVGDFTFGQIDETWHGDCGRNENEVRLE